MAGEKVSRGAVQVASGHIVENNATLTAFLIAAASLLYTTVGQAGGTAFVAVMALSAFPPEEIRPTSLTINIVAAAYATWRLHRSGAVDWRLLRDVVLASLPAAFIGGLLILDGPLYLIVTGTLLLLAAVLMVVRAKADWIMARLIPTQWTALVGALCGFLSGLTGVGGGVFLAPLVIVLGWASPRQAAGISAPFILANSVIGLAGVLAAGQRPASGVVLFAVAALLGAVIGTFVGLRFMSQGTTRYVLAIILTVAGGRLLLAS